MNKIIFFIALTLIGAKSFAQIQNPDETSGGYEVENSDSTESEEQTEGEGEEVDSSTIVKPFVKIELYVDSVTNLITYLGVVEQEESGSDSLYTRAKRWADNRFGKLSKPLYEIDKKNQKLIINGVIPAFVYTSKYAKRDIGTHQFKMTVWIKEGRYKYQISNLVHVGLKQNIGDVKRNYFEFYYTSPKAVKIYDKMLRDADQDIHKLMKEFEKYMQDPIIVDEDDW
ncbi:MAG: DUF4468 domain-containing protein [Bacteroidia bacterium]|nr:DUF4468 domain-containing protein [Bacteroidia bacterium]MCC7532468.1 DUF4468 domain-containing protein [Bacteroidia bacterium]